MDCYLDSSFLVSLYTVDANSIAANAHLRRIRCSIPFTALHSLEFRNALQLGVFRGASTLIDASRVWKNIDADLAVGILKRVEVDWRTVYRLARYYSFQFSASNGARSLDILHVAAAKSVRAKRFISFDSRQRALAGAVGFVVEP